MFLAAFGLAFAFTATRAHALDVGDTEPLDPAAVYVVDGDTIRVADYSCRLTGFEAPAHPFGLPASIAFAMSPSLKFVLAW